MQPLERTWILIVVTIFNSFWCEGSKLSGTTDESDSEVSEGYQQNSESHYAAIQDSEIVQIYNYDFDFDMGLTSGVTPDWSAKQNQSKSSDFIFQSSPGCPEAYQGNPWVFYGNPPRCYLTGYQWPCPQNMKLLPQRSSFYGYCDCNCTQYDFRFDSSTASTFTPRNHCLGQTSDGQTRILSYNKDDGVCHPIFDQGGCPEGDWFVFGDNPLLGSFCEKRRCPIAPGNNNNGTFSFYDYKSKTCHLAGDACQSSNKDWVESDTTFQSTQEDWIPVCLTQPGHTFGAVVYIADQGCPAGQVLSRILKVCVPKRSQKGEKIG